MLKVAIASLFNKNKKYATVSKIQGTGGNAYDTTWFYGS
jgi:hypothetical protein